MKKDGGFTVKAQTCRIDMLYRIEIGLGYGQDSDMPD